jgi:hypothetical protein
LGRRSLTWDGWAGRPNSLGEADDQELALELGSKPFAFGLPVSLF